MAESFRRPRIFISHSGADGFVGVLLKSLRTQLEAAHFEVLIDRSNIPLGGEFRRLINRMMDICDAALVIISPRALDRSWVRDEAARLGRRAEDDPAFRLVPVYVEGTGPQDLRDRESWDPVLLAERNPAGGDDADAVATDVVARLAPVREHVHATEVARGLATTLRKLPQETLSYAVDALFPDGAQMWTAGDLAVEAARRLLVETDDMKPFFKVLKALCVADTRVAADVLEIALPFTWVNRQAAGLLREAGRARTTVWLNTAHMDTADAYVSCASPELPVWRVYRVGREGDPENVDDILQGLRETIAHEAGEFGYDPEVVAMFGDDYDASRRFLAVLCLGFDEQIVDAFEATEFAHFAKVFMAGEVSWDVVPEARREKLVLLVPELNHEDERVRLKGFRALRHLLEQCRNGQRR